MNFRRIHARVSLGALSLIALLALAACTNLFSGPGISVTTTGNDAPSMASSAGDSEDDIIGRREHPRIVATYGGLYANRKAEIILAQIVGRLLTAADQPNAKFTVTILDTPDINAFALPGGYVYVTRGILALANDASELAAVISHEIAHVTLRHARERSNRLRTSEIVDKVITGVLGGNIETDQTVARSRLSLAAFSQAQELAADKEGILVAGKAGYDPHAAARFLGAMERFSSMSRSTDEGEDDFLSSHPSTPDRIEKATETARAFGAPGIGVTDRERYLDAIDGLTFGDNPDHGAIVGKHFVHPALNFTFTVPQSYDLQNTQNAVVGVADDGSALRFDSAEVPPELSLGDYLKSGWIAGLKPETVAEGRIGDVDSASALAATEQWTFRVTVVRLEGAVYRFIFAAKKDTPAFVKAAEETIASFRRTRPSDLRAIKRTIVKTVTAKPGDTIANLSAMMVGSGDMPELFLVLNNLFAGDDLIPGQKYKIVAIE